MMLIRSLMADAYHLGIAEVFQRALLGESNAGKLREFNASGIERDNLENDVTDCDQWPR